VKLWGGKHLKRAPQQLPEEPGETRTTAHLKGNSCKRGNGKGSPGKGKLLLLGDIFASRVKKKPRAKGGFVLKGKRRQEENSLMRNRRQSGERGFCSFRQSAARQKDFKKYDYFLHERAHGGTYSFKNEKWAERFSGNIGDSQHDRG